MAATPWHDWDRRVIGWFLCGLVALVVLLGDPRGEPPEDTTQATTAASPLRLCGSLQEMAVLRDDLVAQRAPTTIGDLRDAATHAHEVGARTTGLDDQSQAGLDYFTGLFLALPDRPTTEQLLTSGTPASIIDQAHADAFVSWLQDNCPQTAP